MFFRYSISILPSPPFNVVLLWTRRANFIAHHVWLQHWFRGVGSVKCPSINGQDCRSSTFQPYMQELESTGQLHGRSLVQIVFQKKCNVCSTKHLLWSMSVVTGECCCAPCICISFGRWFELMTCRATTLFKIFKRAAWLDGHSFKIACQMYRSFCELFHLYWGLCVKFIWMTNTSGMKTFCDTHAWLMWI